MNTKPKIHEKIKHKFLIVIFIIVCVLTGVVLFLKNNNIILSNNSDVAINLKIESENYKYIKTYYSPGSNVPSYIYYISETSDEELININNNILNDLKKSKKITDKTEAFNINYFNNEEIANTYYEQRASKNISPINKLKLLSNYVASMNYSKKMKINNILKISSAKIIKEY